MVHEQGWENNRPLKCIFLADDLAEMGESHADLETCMGRRWQALEDIRLELQ